MTGDLCRRVLAARLLPGRSVVLVGSSRRADGLGDELRERGVRVAQVASAPDEVRGEVRLEAVRLGADWIAADTLVLDDRLLPQAFLLRSLGLLDGRPGTTAPVDADGRLPLPGLWAVGCCVDPDPDHVACGLRGRTVGALAAREVRQGADFRVGRT